MNCLLDPEAQSHGIETATPKASGSVYVGTAVLSPSQIQNSGIDLSTCYPYYCCANPSRVFLPSRAEPFRNQ
jgi:hypothetical protein